MWDAIVIGSGIGGLAAASALAKRRRKVLVSMRQQRRAGEKLFIDYAGATLALADGTRAQVFVAAMAASSYTFACATADQSMRSWLGALARALSFYGGCPQLIVPDNPRALVSKPAATSPSSTRRCATSPVTTASQSFQHVRFYRRTRPSAWCLPMATTWTWCAR
jgi:transposase